jgi:hypothetical protein
LHHSLPIELEALGDEISEDESVPSYLAATSPPTTEPSTGDLISLPSVPAQEQAAPAQTVKM